MSTFVTPGQLARKAEFYRQLGSMTHAGVGVVAGLEHLKRNPPGHELGRWAGLWLQEINQGRTLAEAMQKSQGEVPAFDIALLRAGEMSGRIDECLRLLAQHYEDRARLARQVISELAYPLALFHFAVFIFPFADLFLTGNVLVYLTKTLGVLLPLYLLTGVLLYAMQSRHGEAWQATLEQILHRVPILGKARRNLALGRLAAALEGLINAGVPIFQAWEVAGGACGSPALRKTILSWKPQWSAGVTPAQTIRGSGRFPTMFEQLYTGGEMTGKLDQELRHLHTLYQEEGTRQLHQVAQWTPKLVYLGIMLVIAYKVINFWLGYFAQLNQILQ